MSDRLALIIANSEFDDPKLSRLVTPSRDAEALAQVLSDPAIGGFDVTVRVNETMPVVRKEIARLYQRRKKGDLLLLYYSGHGIRDEHSGDLYLATRDTEMDIVGATAIDTAFVRAELDKSSSQRKVVVLDSCHSGAFAGAKAVVGSSVGTQEAFEGSGYGRVILTASNALEFAWEGDKLLGKAETSVFTHFLVQGLQTGAADRNGDGQISLDELYDYAYEQVVTSGRSKQTPQKWAQKVEGQIIIAQNPHPVVKPAELPLELQQAIESPFPGVREGAVSELEHLLHSSDKGLALAAHEALTCLADDDSRRVSAAAARALGVSPVPVPAKPFPTPLSPGIEKTEPEPEPEPKPKPPHISRWSSIHDYLVLLYEVVWLLLLLGSLLFDHSLAVFIANMTGVTFSDLASLSMEHIFPLWNTMAWGGIGGVMGSLYNLYWYATVKQDFDKQRLMWHIVQPIMGVILGSIVYLIIAAGFISVQVLAGQVTGFTEAAQAMANPAIKALHSVVAFVAGFRQRSVYDVLDRIVPVLTLKPRVREDIKALARSSKPESLIGCPICNVKVKAGNLVQHCDRDHAADIASNAESVRDKVRAMLEWEQSTSRWSSIYGYLVLLYEVVWLLLLLSSVLFDHSLAVFIANMTGMTFYDLASLSMEHIFPLWNTMAWGGIGGVMGSLYNLYWYATVKQDFDKQRLMWHIVQPIMGVILGSIVYLIIAAGFISVQVLAAQAPTFGEAAQAMANPAIKALLSVVAFVAGFRQRSVYEMLDWIVPVLTLEPRVREDIKALARSSKPESLIGCPICNVKVKAGNLVQHCDKYHAAEMASNAESVRDKVRPMLEWEQSTSRWSSIYGYLVLLYEVVWLPLLLGSLLFDHSLAVFIANMTRMTFSDLAFLSMEHIFPMWNPMAWGGIGGVMGSLYRLVAVEQDFDRQYLTYMVQPIIAVILGGIGYLIIASVFISIQVLAGQATDFSQAAQAMANPAIKALLSVVAFGAGFRQRSVYDMLGRWQRGGSSSS